MLQVGNSGMFRPEMLRPMGLPEDVNVIAWGLGLERYATHVFSEVMPLLSAFQSQGTAAGLKWQGGILHASWARYMPAEGAEGDARLRKFYVKVVRLCATCSAGMQCEQYVDACAGLP